MRPLRLQPSRTQSPPAPPVGPIERNFTRGAARNCDAAPFQSKRGKQMTKRTLSHPARLMALAVLVAPVIGAAAAPPPLGPLPERVVFASADGHTMLTGYVFKPEGSHPPRV